MRAVKRVERGCAELGRHYEDSKDVRPHPHSLFRTDAAVPCRLQRGPAGPAVSRVIRLAIGFRVQVMYGEEAGTD